MNRIESIEPGNTQRGFGDWMAGFVAGQRSTVPGAEPDPEPSTAEAHALWAKVLAFCTRSPGKTLFDAATAVTQAP